MSNTTRSPAGTLTGRDWNEITGKADPRCDPYLVWFDLTYLPDLQPDGKRRQINEKESIDILLELSDDAVASLAKVDALLKQLLAVYQFVPRTRPSPHGQPRKFICGYLPVAKMFALSEAIANGTRDLRFELASPRYIKDVDAAQMQLQFVEQEVLKSAVVDKWTSAFIGTRAWSLQALLDESRRQQARQLTKEKPAKAMQEKLIQAAPVPAKPLVVVIDDYCNHASVALANRVRSIWYQGRPDRALERLAGLTNGDGMLHAKADVDPRAEWYGQVKILKPKPAAAARAEAGTLGPDERHAYADQEASRTRARHHHPPVWSHGSAVLSMLTQAERRSPPGVCPDGLDALEAPDDIEFVQLPDAAVLDTSGGSLSGFALEGIHRAVRLASHPPRPAVIVNLSFGTHSGPHDGTSMFERAVLELLDRYDGSTVDYGKQGKAALPKLHVVLPAGNTHAERTHASALLDAQGGTCDLLWMIQADSEADSFIEIWLDDAKSGDVDVTLLPPRNDRSRAAAPGLVASPGDVKAWPDDDVLQAAVIYPRTTSKGLNGRMALIAVAPTQQRANQGLGETYRTGREGPPDTDPQGRVQDALERRRMQAAPGCWTVRLTNKGPQPVRFHAWIQRHDAAPGRRRAGKGYQGRQSYFVDAPGTHVDPRFTINGIATAKYPGQLWVVGAMDERGRIPVYSAAGPDRLYGERIDGPDVSAVVDRSRNVPGRHVHGVFSGSRLRMGGTSIGAAVFTRMLYHTLERGGTMAWCTPDKLPPPPLKPDGVTELAEDWMRGSNQRLRHKKDLAVSTPSCEDRHRTADAPGSCKP